MGKLGLKMRDWPPNLLQGETYRGHLWVSAAGIPFHPQLHGKSIPYDCCTVYSIPFQSSLGPMKNPNCWWKYITYIYNYTVYISVISQHQHPKSRKSPNPSPGGWFLVASAAPRPSMDSMASPVMGLKAPRPAWHWWTMRFWCFQEQNRGFLSQQKVASWTIFDQ